jgi:hypothetical protein
MSSILDPLDSLTCLNFSAGCAAPLRMAEWESRTVFDIDPDGVCVCLCMAGAISAAQSDVDHI